MRIFAIFLICILWASAALAERRALVVGINEYENLRALKKAIGDARAIEPVLRKAGYQVVRLENPDRQEFWKVWDDFLKSIDKWDEVAFFFSGHGVEIDGSNFLLPKDSPNARAGERIIKQEAIKFGELLAELQGREPRTSLIILDACRDNPFEPVGGKSIGGTKGLARVAPPEGAFVMYSAGLNQTALDRLSDSDPEPTSVYMRRLLPLLERPGLKIQDVAIEVRSEVRRLAATVPHSQSPAYYDNLTGNLCFAGCQIEPPKVQPAVGIFPEPTKLTRLDPNRAFEAIAVGLNQLRLAK